MKRFLFLTIIFVFPVSALWADDDSYSATPGQDELSSMITPATADARALFDKAKSLFDEKNYKDCKDILTSLVAQHPADDFTPQARLLLAKVQEDFDISVAQLREVSEEYDDLPEGMEAQKELGDRFYLADRYEDAVDAYQEYLDRYEKSPMAVEVHYWLGCSYSAAGQDKKAIEEYQKAVDLGGKTDWAPKALLGMGNTYFGTQKFSDAESRYLRILDQYALYDEMNLVYLKLGETYEMEKKWKQAYAAYQTLAARFPKAMEVAEAQTRLSELEKIHPELESLATPSPEGTATATVTATTTAGPTVFVSASPTATVISMTVTPTETAEPTPEEMEREETVDEPVLKSTPFHVQMGVYTQKANIVKVEKAIRKAGYAYYLVTVKRDQDAYPLYKIRVGHFATRAEAKKIAAVLAKKTKEKAIVVEE